MRFAVPLTVAFALLLVVVAIAWRPTTPDPAPVACAVEYVPPRQYQCPRSIGPITIDGRLDEAAWKDVPWSEDFVDIEGDLKPKPRLRTRMKMTWDETALYIAAELDEPHVWGTLTKHDSVIFHDNDFEVFLDPDGDHHAYGELELNSLNTTWDLFLTKPYRAGCKAIDDWEIRGLRTAVHVDGTINDPRDIDRGWTLEIAWPWSGMKQFAGRPVPPKAGDAWRINFSRVEWDHEIVNGKYVKIPKRPEHNWVWSPQGVIDMHRPSHWGYLIFRDTIDPIAAPWHDPTGPARLLLYGIYEAQRAYHTRHGRYASDLNALGLAGVTHKSLAGPVMLEATRGTYEASVELKTGGRVRIRADELVTVEP